MNDMKTKHVLLLLLALLVPAFYAGAQCDNGATACMVTVACSDALGDGWNGAAILVYQGSTLRGTVSPTQGYEVDVPVVVCSGDTVRFVWQSGPLDGEIFFSIYNGDGSLVVADVAGYDLSNGTTIAAVMPACPSCVAPYNLTCQHDSTTATIGWSQLNGEGAWLVSLNGQASVMTSSSSYTFNNLTINTDYTVSVRTLCGDGDTSEAAYISFRTGCGPLTLPYFNNFDGEAYEGLPNCWHAVMAYGDLPKVFDDYAYSDSLSLFFGATHDYNIVCTPAVPVAGNEIAVNFQGYIELGLVIQGIPFITSWLEAGVMTDPSDTSTFIALVSVDTMDNQWHEYEFNTSALDSSAQYHVAFRFYGDDIFWGNASVDDLSITHYNGCDRPLLTYVDSVGSHTALLRWDMAGANADGYDIYLSTENHPQSATYYGSTQDTFMLVSGLQQSTTYYMWVRTVCGDVNADYKAFPAFTTTLTCAPVNGVELTSVNYTAAVLEWQYDYYNGNTPTGVTVRLYDLNDTDFYDEQEVEGTSALLTGLAPSHVYRACLYTTCQLGEEVDTANGVCFDFMTESCSHVSGNGLSGVEYVLNTNYSSSYLQTLYTSDELAGLDTIYGIAFQATNEVSQELTFDLYMCNTTLGALGSTAYVPYDTLTPVKVGHTIVPGPAGWQIVMLDTPFVRDTSRNLVVATLHSSSYLYLNPIQWAYHVTPGVRTYGWNNLGTLTPTAPPTYFMQSCNGAADVRFVAHCTYDGCMKPTIYDAEVDTTSVALSWYGEAEDYVVQYKTASQTGYSMVGSTNETTFTVTGLTPSTAYMIRVGALCDGDTLWDQRQVLTECGVLTVPYAEDFDAYPDLTMPPCWRYNPSLAGHLYGGLVFAISNSTTAAQHAAVLPMLDMDIASLQINLRAKLRPVAYGDALLIGVADDEGYNIEWVDTLSDANQSHASFTWFGHSFEQYSGTNTRIAISYITQSNDFDYYGALVDDISVTAASSCPIPAGLTTLNNGNAAAIVATWHGNAAASLYEVRWDTVGTPVGLMANVQTTTDTFYSLPPLTAGGKYECYVRSLCNAESSAWRSLDFAAGGVIMASNSSDTVVGCGLVIYDDGGSTDNYSNGSTSILVVRPSDASSAVIFTGGTIDLSPWGGDGIYVYEGEGTSGQLLFSCTVTYGAQNYVANVVSETGALTFKFVSDGYDNAMGYELFTGCTALPSCPRPHGVTVSATSSSSALVSWSGNANHYDVYYRPTGDATWQIAGSNSTTLLLTGLQEGTAYELYVVGYCDAGEVSPNSVTVTFATPCDATAVTADTPINEDFEDAEAPANCFTLHYANNSSANTMTHSTDRAFAGSRSFRFSSYYTSNDYNQYLISPQLMASDSLTLRFRYCDAMYGQEKMRVGYSTTGNNASDFVWVDTLVTQGNVWLKYQRDFPPATKFIAINYFSDYRYYAYVDSLRIGVVASADCPMPQITNIDEAAESITVHFEASGAVEAYITNQAWSDNVSGTVVNGNVYTFTGLMPNTSYTLGLRSNCGNGLSSTWTTASVITAIQGCEPPEGFQLVDAGYNSATFSWDDGDGDEWEINLYNTGFNQSYTATGSPLTVTGLGQDIHYTAKIRRICYGMPGAWSSQTIELLTPSCPPVSDVQWTLHSGANNTASVSLSWQGSADAYEIEYGEEHFPVAGGITISDIHGTEYTIEGLEYDFSYDLYIRAICGDGIYSLWSSRINFTPTNEGVAMADGEIGIALCPNPATDHTTLQVKGIAGEVVIELIDLNGRLQLSETRHCDGICEQRLEVGRLQRGVYFVRINNGHTCVVKKLVVK